ncbi:MAG: polysaccharide lyase 6 family protein [Planctomycetota bacterium]
MKRLNKQLGKLVHRVAVVVMAILFVQRSVCGTEFFVSSASDITSALQSAQPGDILTMTDGTWTNQTINFTGFGTSSNPITLRAQTPGQVILNGSSTLNISGDWLVADGLLFEGGSLPDGSNAIVEFRGGAGEATNSRFTNSAIIDYNAADVDDRYHWLEIFGQNNRVDNNRFEGQNHSGVTVVVRRDNSSAQHHLIDRNHFVDRPAPINPSSTNGFETIRVGTSSQSLSDSFTTVENNLFERTDGEIEIISNKSGNNTFQYNTFRESAGTLTLRHGDDNVVKGNFFLGENKDRSGGIRVIGERQTIVNNYIANVDDRADGAISLTTGVVNSPANRYFQVKDAVIAHNTIVDVAGPAVIFDYLYDPIPDPNNGELQNLRPENVTLANNLFRSSGPAIFDGTEGSGWTWEGNIAFDGSLDSKTGDAGITVIDPDLQLDGNGLWRPSASSPAIDGGQGSYSGLLSDDMDGEARIGIFDVGADEYYPDQSTIVRKPLTGEDIGPAWFGEPIVDPPGGGGCFANGCAIQAEDYTSVLDPDNDGFVWTKSSVAEALGGEVIVAPNGTRVDVPGDTHDSIATYDLTFQEAGTYRAYYRARGFSGSTDSIYVPDDFETDPDNIESLANNGEFRWEVGDTFTILQSHVGVPLEFRIGRREQSAQLDALVLNLDLFLTETELDALFDIVLDPADFNEDGFVNATDLAAWQTGYGMTSAATRANGDADGDGDVDGADFMIWQRNLSNTALAANLAANVPEPTSVTLLVFLCLTVSVGRRREHSFQHCRK